MRRSRSTGLTAALTVVGIDLSGPGNPADTAVAWLRARAGGLEYAGELRGADDRAILDLVAGLEDGAAVIVGLDAPLSYNPGGGDRPGDRKLRARLRAAGVGSVSVMPPTLTRMAYLTLRGLAVARALATLGAGAPRIVEVHPGAACALRGADARLVRGFKREAAARRGLLAWLERRGLRGIAGLEAPTDHLVAACAAALAAWRWACGRPAWVEPAAPPLHPFDFAC
jgi:predicted nuclease with RNAse H fold